MQSEKIEPKSWINLAVSHWSQFSIFLKLQFVFSLSVNFQTRDQAVLYLLGLMSECDISHTRLMSHSTLGECDITKGQWIHC